MKSEKNILSIARAVLEKEAMAIASLSQLIDSEFEACVQKILKSSGRVVVTGIGKSALIGQKIVATLNSTGTPALFMHAADAIHGDLGMIQTNDVVIAISRSGETSEIKVLIPLLKRSRITLIGLVSNRNSYLGQQSDHILHAHAPEEADSLNLAPTVSTTAALAMGDALAICLLECRGFTSQDFARFHPGGTLGKKLYLRVSDIYPGNQCPTVTETASAQEVILEISSKLLGATAVISSDGSLAGIITDGDLRRKLNQEREGFFSTKAFEIMTRNPLCIQADEYAIAALQLMQARSVTQLIVLSGKKAVGFIHLHNLLKEGLV